MIKNRTSASDLTVESPSACRGASQALLWGSRGNAATAVLRPGAHSWASLCLMHWLMSMLTRQSLLLQARNQVGDHVLMCALAGRHPDRSRSATQRGPLGMCTTHTYRNPCNRWLSPSLFTYAPAQRRASSTARMHQQQQAVRGGRGGGKGGQHAKTPRLDLNSCSQLTTLQGKRMAAGWRGGAGCGAGVACVAAARRPGSSAGRRRQDGAGGGIAGGPPGRCT